MSSLAHPRHDDSIWRRALGDTEVRVALVAAVCLVLEAVIAKNVLDTELDFITQFAPFWIFVAYLVSGLRDRSSEIWFIAATVITTAGVLILYAL